MKTKSFKYVKERIPGAYYEFRKDMKGNDFHVIRTGEEMTFIGSSDESETKAWLNAKKRLVSVETYPELDKYFHIPLTDNIVRLWYSVEFHQDGKPHREDGPAIFHDNGVFMWVRNNKYYREDGPAVHSTPNKERYDVYFKDGKECTRRDFYERSSVKVELTREEIALRLNIPVEKLVILN